MTVQTWGRDDFEGYLDFEYPLERHGSAAARADETRNRNTRMASFPHSVLLRVAFAEMDFANRWCWQQFGPSDGQCLQPYSEYPACSMSGKHEHRGTWMSHWLAKTDYNFGYNEWHFSNLADRDRFVEYLPQVNWGENFPKQP